MTTRKKENDSNDKIHEALELLNEAAKGKKEEVSGAINAKYEHLRDMFVGVIEDGQCIAEDAKKTISKTLQVEEKRVKEVVAQIDKDIRKNPWPYVGGAVLGSLCIGLLLARKN